MVRFRALGPVELAAGDRLFELGPPQRRAVLAALLVDAGRPVNIQAVIDRVWGDAPPTAASRALYAHIARLRAVLAEARTVEDGPPRLVRRSGGYVLEVDRGDVDLHRFQRLADRAGHATRTDAERAGLLREALDLWRGEPLAGIAGQWAALVRDRWQQRRLDVTVRWALAEVRLGRPGAVLADLLELVSEHPLSEAPVAALMRALHAAGRTGDALERYAALRERLVDELGTEPGAELRDLHQAILRDELELPAARPDAPPHAAAALRPVPAQLPLDVHGFTGRLDELATLDKLAGLDEAATAVVISAVSGTAGVGKTALAVHWAQRVRDRFPDGQLYADLHGYGPDQPTEPAEALAGLLRELGVEDTPVDVAARANRYRSLLAGRRMLVVLDNAASVEQVRPLLPGSASCMVLVTSRDSLAGLVARDGARRVDLDLLPLHDAVALLRALIGDRVVAEPAAAVLLAERCARLPLALRVAAELAVAHPYRDLRSLADELRAEQDRLDVLDAGGDDRTAVRAVFSWSYRHLPAPAARAFGLLGLHPGREFDVPAVAALAGLGDGAARRLVDTLVRAHLIHHVTGDRYGIHDLLRAYAVERAAEGGGPGRDAAVARLYGYYLGNVAVAMDSLYAAERPWRRPVEPPVTVVAGLAEPSTAGRWLDAERANLVAVAAAAATDRPADTTLLAATLWRYLELGGHHDEAYTMNTHALDAAHRLGDPVEVGTALVQLGVVHWRRGDLDQAAGCYERALASFQDGGDRRGCARALSNLGIVYLQWARLDDAADHYERANLLYRELGDPIGEARMLNNLGQIHSRRGRYDQAAEAQRGALALSRRTGDRYVELGVLNDLANTYERRGHYELAADHFRQALAIARETGNRSDEVSLLANLGGAYQRQGRYGEALDHLRRALRGVREVGVPTTEAWTLDQIGVVHQRLGDHERAIEHHRQAVAVARRVADHVMEASALNSLGDAYRATGQLGEAGARYRHALSLADQTGDQCEQARAHDGLARVRSAEGDREGARWHCAEALVRYDGLGMPEATAVRDRLAELTGEDTRASTPEQSTPEHR